RAVGSRVRRLEPGSPWSYPHCAETGAGAHAQTPRPQGLQGFGVAGEQDVDFGADFRAAADGEGALGAAPFHRHQFDFRVETEGFGFAPQVFHQVDVPPGFSGSSHFCDRVRCPRSSRFAGPLTTTGVTVRSSAEPSEKSRGTGTVHNFPRTATNRTLKTSTHPTTSTFALGSPSPLPGSPNSGARTANPAAAVPANLPAGRIPLHHAEIPIVSASNRGNQRNARLHSGHCGQLARGVRGTRRGRASRPSTED